MGGGVRQRGALLALLAVLAAAGLGAYWLLGTSALPDLVAPRRPAPEGSLPLESPEGEQLIVASTARAAFLPLMSHFRTQRTDTYCGVASVAMVLNALGVSAPPSAHHPDYPEFTQTNLLGPRTDHIRSASKIAAKGMGLDAVAELLEVYGVEAKAVRARTTTSADFRRRAAEYLARSGHHVIVNYDRKVLGQAGRGHISPLGAYHAESDRFLLLDVSRYKAPPVWLSTDKLFQAMAERIGVNEPETRGFVLVSAP